MPIMIAFAMWVRPVIHKSRKAEVKQICARSISRPKPIPNSMAIPSFGASNSVQSDQATDRQKITMPKRKRRRACSGFCVNGAAAFTFCNFTGMRNIGNRVNLAPK
ncbi:hypothetical protein D3C86_1963710 [compost metagenome]